jgi:DeoR/GlpR family transcriptional regulator of sugar metabolism
MPTSGSPRTRTAAATRAVVIREHLHAAGFASISTLSQELGVSEMTVRRDLRKLDAAGEVRLVHGGASLPHGTLRTVGFTARARQHADAKQRIARAAAALVAPGATVAIDSGTTCFAVAAALDPGFDGCLVTHSIPVLQLALSLERCTVIALGGEVFTESQAVVGPSAAIAARSLSVDVLFLGANSIDGQGVYLRSEREHPVKAALMESAHRTVLLADHDKLARTAPVRLCALSAVDVLVTDRPPSESVRDACAEAGVTAVVAP